MNCPRVNGTSIDSINRGTHVTLALVSAFAADAEFAYRLALRDRARHDNLPLVALQFALQASVNIAFTSDKLPGWMYVARDFLNFPVLYSFCYGYLFAADPAALFGGGVHPPHITSQLSLPPRRMSHLSPPIVDRIKYVL